MGGFTGHREDVVAPTLPASSTDNAVVRWNGTGGDTLQDAGVLIDDNDNVTIPGTLATTRAQITLGAAATTFAATDSNYLEITGDAGANTVATITGGTSGQLLILTFVDALVTITDTDAHTADTVDLDSAFTSADDVTLMLVHDGTSWYEVGRSAAAASFTGDLNGNDLSDSSDNIVTVAATDQLILAETEGDHSAAPTLGFGDGDTGIYKRADGFLSFGINSALRMEMDVTGLSGNASRGGVVRAPASALTTPAHSFVDDLNSGLHQGAADQCSVVAGGVEMIRATESTAETLNAWGMSSAMQTFSFGDMTDNGDATGQIDLSIAIPDGSLFVQAVATALTGFTGDTSATIQIGDGTDVDRYSTGTPDVFVTNASGVALGAPSGTVWHDASVANVRVTITSGADFTSVSAGTVTIMLFWYGPMP